MAEIRDVGASVKYLAGYVSSGEKFVRCWSSQGWVFRGWVGMSRNYKREFGEYPARGDLVALSKMSRAVRAGELEWLLWTGQLSSDVEWSKGREGGVLEREEWLILIRHFGWAAVLKARDEFHRRVCT